MAHKVHIKASRNSYHPAPKQEKHKGMCIEVYIPDEILEDPHTSERIVKLALEDVRERLVDGVFKRPPMYKVYD